jgi:uncharacterized membrane protein YfcA
LEPLQYLVGVLSGALVGLALGLVGGGGSILCVPLLLYGVGVGDLHLAIGTSSLAVAMSASLNLLGHMRRGSVSGLVACLFTSGGVVGATLGSQAGKAFDGRWLSACFAILIFLVGAIMLKFRFTPATPALQLDRRNSTGLLVTGGFTGAVCGFFGIGGGFLIVPGLMYAGRLPILQAVGSSLVAVTAFGFTTAANYARAGWVDWQLAALLVLGSTFGGALGIRLAERLSAQKGRLQLWFAVITFLVAGYMLYRSAYALTRPS